MYMGVSVCVCVNVYLCIDLYEIMCSCVYICLSVTIHMCIYSTHEHTVVISVFSNREYQPMYYL